MKILLFGGSGMLGSVIKAEAPKLNHEVIAPSHSICDITNYAQLTSAFPFRSVDLVINASGIIPGANEDFAANAVGAFKIAKISELNHVPLIHVSTDCVFSGRRSPWHSNKDVPDPIDLYGVSKRYGEVAVQTVLPSASIVRTSFIGLKHGLLRWFLDQPHGAEIDGYDEALWSGSTVYEVARRILSPVIYSVGGITHLATDTPYSKYEVLCILRDAIRPDITVNRTKEPIIHRALEPTVRLESIDVVLPELIKKIK